MKNRYEVDRSPAVDAWIDEPHRDRRVVRAVQLRVLRAVGSIERLGPLSSDDDLKKLREDLYQTRVLDWRILSVIRGNHVIMADVVIKKKGRLTSAQLDAAERRIAAYMSRRGNPPKGD